MIRLLNLYVGIKLAIARLLHFLREGAIQIPPKICVKLSQVETCCLDILYQTTQPNVFLKIDQIISCKGIRCSIMSTKSVDEILGEIFTEICENDDWLRIFVRNPLESECGYMTVQLDRELGMPNGFS